MSYRQTFRRSRLAEWGFRLSILTAHLVVFTILLHRYAGQSTAVSLNLLQIGFIGALIAFGMCLVAAVQIWNRLLKGFGQSIAGLVLSALVIAWPLSLVPLYLVTAEVYDISTDTGTPPAFEALKKFRAFGSNPVAYTAPADFTPEVRPLRLYKSGQDSFDLVRQLVIKRKWELVSAKPPVANKGIGIIEAVDHSLVLAVPDDIVIRITTRGGRSVLDMRSQARYGSYDLGRNQKRVQDFLSDMISQNAGVEEVNAGEQPFLPGEAIEVEEEPETPPIPPEDEEEGREPN